ncbi:sirohydrochlorin chelatase [Frankia sp. CiP1_Cm_nod1]|uniref:sirohydrochlorin chelatase n=1 Tax=Frankia sp. CiP1_Cm_nod1 TaxID=2897160 RepID=UPI004043D125
MPGPSYPSAASSPPTISSPPDASSPPTTSSPSGASGASGRGTDTTPDPVTGAISDEFETSSGGLKTPPAEADPGVTGGHHQIHWHAVEPAFLDVVQPDIMAGYASLAAAGCTEIVAHPFFLFDGSHTSRDIPAALARARERFPHTRWTLTAPLGLHPGVLTAVTARIDDALTGHACTGHAFAPDEP